MKTLKATIVILVALILPLEASAIGISVSPSSLDVRTKAGEEVTTVITVQNDATDVSLFEAYTDTFEDIIEVRPASFILESGETRQVSITVEANKEQTLQATISVISKAITDSAFNASGGVKIPITAVIGEGSGEVLGANTQDDTDTPWLVIVFGSISALFILCFGVMFGRRLKK